MQIDVSENITRPEITSEHFDPTYIYVLDLRRKENGERHLVLSIDVLLPDRSEILGRFEFEQFMEIPQHIAVSAMDAVFKGRTRILDQIATFIKNHVRFDRDGNIIRIMVAHMNYESDLKMTPNKPDAALTVFPLAGRQLDGHFDVELNPGGIVFLTD